MLAITNLIFLHGQEAPSMLKEVLDNLEISPQIRHKTSLKIIIWLKVEEKKIVGIIIIGD
ncbi:MAG: hypothetical protein ACTSQP_15395 [Promethearchaeota archaeon]